MYENHSDYNAMIILVAHHGAILNYTYLKRGMVDVLKYY